MGERGESREQVVNENIAAIERLYDKVMEDAQTSEEGRRLATAIEGQAKFEIALHNMKTLIENGKNFAGIEGDEEKIAEAKRIAKEAMKDLNELGGALRTFEWAGKEDDLDAKKAAQQRGYERAKAVIDKYQWDKE